jgi:hypothetical protein
VCLHNILSSFQAAATSSKTSNTPDLVKIEKEIQARSSLVRNAVLQPDSVHSQTIDTAMALVDLLKQKYEAQRGVSGTLVC